MRRNSKLILGISLSVLIVISTAVILFVTLKPKNKLIEHEAIFIWSDEDFENYNFKGKGTQKKPYLIQNLNITTESKYCIYIRNTTLFFTIQNCYLDGDISGIFISNIATGTAKIIDNICRNNFWYGMEIINSDSITIISNICSDSPVDIGAGISITNSKNAIIKDNYCFNTFNGIYLWNSDSAIITNNTCKENYLCGISMHDSKDSIINKNDCSDNNDERPNVMELENHGIRIVDSANSTLIDNICSYNEEYGISLLLSPNSTIENNDCNNNKKYSIYNHKSNNSQILGNNCDENEVSIYIEEAINGTIIENICDSSLTKGIELLRSSNYTIQGNLIIKNNMGIYLNNTDFCEISYNLIRENGIHGIILLSGSDNNTIYHNSFIDNNIYGSSQASDSGYNNKWFNETLLEGNYWSDIEFFPENYSIDGSSNSYDPYPLEENPLENLIQVEIQLILREIQVLIFHEKGC